MDDRGLVHILNENGSKPPLIWCFNAPHEFQILAEKLGPEQPIIGLRSLHLVARIEPGRGRHDREMANHYADFLLGALPDRPCYIGGNCQGATIAFHIARRWLLAGRQCPHFISMEMEPPLPLPLPCTLLFGANSTMFNPYLKGDHGAPLRWKNLVAFPSDQIIPGGHGEYFNEINVIPLSNTLHHILNAPPLAQPDLPPVRLFTTPLPRSHPVGATLSVRVRVERASDTPAPTITLCAIWQSAEGQDVHGLTSQIADGSLCQFDIRTPELPGKWELILYPACPPFGPVSWADHLNPIGQLETFAMSENPQLT